MPTPYPPAPPSVAGQNITMDAFLNNPPRVQRTIEALALQRFIADRIFAGGPQATGGAVLYDQLLASDFFSARDVQAIEPATEFPILNSGETMPLVAAVTKWGGSAVFSYEMVRRDRRDVLNRELTRLRNTIIRKVDTVGIAALNASPTYTMPASADWSINTTKILNDIFTAVSTVDEADMGYAINAAILHPAQALDIRLNDQVSARLGTNPGQQGQPNLLAAPDLRGLAGIDNWYVSNRQAAGTVVLLAERQIGGISDEVPLYSRTVDEQTKERYRVMSARITVPYVTDPKAAIRIQGA